MKLPLSGPRALLALCVSLSACKSDPKSEDLSDSGDAGGGPPVFCEGPTSQRWDITDRTDIDFFPDGLLETADPESPTGRRVDVSEASARWLPGMPALLKDAVSSLNELSGFGTVGGVLVRFDGGTVQDVPGSAEASTTDDGWMLLDLSGPTPERVPFSVEVQEDGASVVVWPLRPLRLGSEHAFIITSSATADDGGCISAHPTTRALLYGDELPDHPHAEETAERYRSALDTLDLRADEVSVITVFTTHDETQKWRGLAAEAASEAVEWGSFSGCTERGWTLQCTVNVPVTDRRNEAGLVDATIEGTTARSPATVWLPNDGSTGPYPVVIYGHGLGSSTSEGYIAGALMAEAGVAVIALDAVAHGAHPTAGGGDSYTAALGFLGLDLATFSINPKLLRGNFDQTNLDRVRLLNLIRNHPDFNGDGQPDFDPDQIGYMGVSLGAILGPQLVSVSPEVQGALFSVGGGRLMSIVTDTEALTDFEELLASLVGSKERFDRLVPIAQHVVDPADSALWGAHVIHDRFDDAPAPHVLLQVGVYDEVVPKTSGYALARAMRLPHMQPVAEEVDFLQSVGGPLAGNGVDGATHAFFQFDRVTNRGRVGEARHVETPTSEEGQLQMRAFVEGWLENGLPEVIDPYAELGTPEL